MLSRFMIRSYAITILLIVVAPTVRGQSAQPGDLKAPSFDERQRLDDERADFISLKRYGNGFKAEQDAIFSRRPIQNRSRVNADVSSKWTSVGTSIEDVKPLPPSIQDPEKYYGSPALLSLDNGEVALAYTEYGEFPEWRPFELITTPKLWFTKTADGGVTWQEPVLVAEGEHGANFMYMTMVRTASGRLLINDEAYFRPNHLFYSDDDGATWTGTDIVEYSGTMDRLYGPFGGEVWHPYRDLNDDALKYIASADGITWSEPRIMMENPQADSVRLAVTGIVETSPGNLVAVLYRLMFDPCCNRNAAVVQSSDGGLTWSEPRIIDTGTLQPRMFGRLRMSQGGVLGYVFQDQYCLWCQWDENYFQNNIYYLSSDDLGATWSPPSRFTKYIGTDFHPDLAFAGETPLVVFGTNRYTPIHPLGLWAYSHVWYGVPGVSQEGPAALPPRTDFISYGVTPAGPDVPLRVMVEDEAGVETVVLRAQRVSLETGDPVGDQVEKALFDDGTHSDRDAGDGVWGNTFDLELHAAYDLTVVATGVDGVASENIVSLSRTIPAHASGGLAVAIDGTRLGISPFSGYPSSNLTWPTQNDLGNLWFGWFMLGTDHAPGGQTVVKSQWPSSEEGTSINALGDDITVRFEDTTDLTGLHIEQRSHTYGTSYPDSSEFIVFQYFLKNLGDHNFENLVAGMRLDLDIPLGSPGNAGIPFTSEPNPAPAGAGDDVVCYDEEHEIVYQYDSGVNCVDFGYECPTIHIGLGVLSDSVLSAARWTEWADDLENFSLMTSGIDPSVVCDVLPDPADYRYLITARPFDLSSGDSAAVAFGLVAGDGFDEMLVNASFMRTAYETLFKTRTVTGIEEEPDGSLPMGYALHQNYPNPFNPVTSIVFEIPGRVNATLKIFDILGREQATLHHGALGPGRYRYEWDASSYPGGVYFYRLETGTFSATRKLVLLR